MNVTPAALRMITAIHELELEDTVRYHRHSVGVRGRELARRLWPDAPGWNTHANSGGLGSGMPRTAGCHAGKLSRLEQPLTYYIGWREGWTLTKYGREVVIESRKG